MEPANFNTGLFYINLNKTMTMEFSSSARQFAWHQLHKMFIRTRTEYQFGVFLVCTSIRDNRKISVNCHKNSKCTCHIKFGQNFTLNLLVWMRLYWRGFCNIRNNLGRGKCYPRKPNCVSHMTCSVPLPTTITTTTPHSHENTLYMCMALCVGFKSTKRQPKV